MSFVILDNESGKIIRPRQYAPNYASLGAAKAGATTMVKKGNLVAGSYSVILANKVPARPVTVTNLLSGATVIEDVNTPYCCSVASESYWSN
jgi:hypothetical protein